MLLCFFCSAASDGPEEVNEEDLIEEEMYDDVEGASSSQLSVPSIEVSTSPGDNAPSCRLPSSPLPDLPPTPDGESEESQPKTSKAKTLLKGLKLKKSKKSTSPMPKAFIKGGHIYMYKKGTFGGGNWEKRYCCITGEAKLCFSSADDETDKKGVIELRPNAKKVKTKDAHNDKKVEAHPYLMLIAKSTMAFTSAEDRKEWMTEIEYSVSEGLELDSEDEDESAGYNLQSEWRCHGSTSHMGNVECHWQITVIFNSIWCCSCVDPTCVTYYLWVGVIEAECVM